MADIVTPPVLSTANVTATATSTMSKITSFFSNNKKTVIIALALLAVLIVVIILWRRSESYASYQVNDEYNTEGFYVDASSNDPNEVKKVVLFYAPWCSHCKKFMEGNDSVWNALSSKATTNVVFDTVNCEENKETAEQYNIKNLPTIKIITNSGVKTYEGDRSLESLQHFISN